MKFDINYGSFFFFLESIIVVIPSKKIIVIINEYLLELFWYIYSVGAKAQICTLGPKPYSSIWIRPKMNK